MSDASETGTGFLVYQFLAPISGKGKVKDKEVDLCSAFIVVPHTQGAQIRITQ